MNPTTDKKNGSFWPIDAAGLGACAAATLAAYLFVIVPLMEQRTTVARQDEQIAAQYQKRSKLNSSMLTLKKYAVGMKKELAGMEIRLEPTDHLNQRIADLTAMLTRCGLELDDVRTGHILRGATCDLVPIGLSGRGGYIPCMAFLREIHATLPDMAVVRCDLTGNPETSKPGQFVFDLFWYTAPTAQSVRKDLSRNK